MSGIDARTGKPLVGWAHVEQSIYKLMTTQIGVRIRREHVGFPATQLLGKNLSPALLLRFKHTLAMVIDLFEPRFTVKQVFDVDASQLRAGKVGIRPVGDYHPNGHLGDQSTTETRELLI